MSFWAGFEKRATSMGKYYEYATKIDPGAATDKVLRHFKGRKSPVSSVIKKEDMQAFTQKYKDKNQSRLRNVKDFN